MDTNDLEYIPVTQDVELYTLRVEITVSPDGSLVIHLINDPVVTTDA